ncbi:PREDICTED: protein E6 [Tarenaya hassleriana]|uniref:protein E6 n=1 Tax=Tarenaya hassleriana TaxID=28532 RepID=UPI00053C9BAB|nr:PREDICTED: protein E6 [Tarenaya hassleriana]
MASFNRSFFFFFITVILSTLLLSTQQIHARESFFFHKFQRDRNPSSVPVEATHEKTSVELPPKKEQQEPSFVPESENGYGLYGHETTYDNKNNNNNNEEFKYEENVNYEPSNTPTSLSQADDESYNLDKYSKDNEYYNNNNNDNNENYYNSNAFGRERSKGYNSYNNEEEERQGMSDTRFMEKGKYFFDPNDDKNHGDMYKKHYRNKPSYQVNNYNSFRQNNNEENGFQDPYNSPKWEKNTMNEQEQEQEFGGEEQQEQFAP